MTTPTPAGAPRENIAAENAATRLTCIGHAYTLAATDGDASEVDQLTVKHFIETLAEVALAVGSRKTAT